MGLTVTNVSQGNTAQFVAEFLDVNGNVTVPAGGTLNITYPTTNPTPGSTSASTSISMTLQNSFFTATWYSSVSGLGNGTWSITSIGSTATAAQGNLRIITP